MYLYIFLSVLFCLLDLLSNITRCLVDLLRCETTTLQHSWRLQWDLFEYLLLYYKIWGLPCCSNEYKLGFEPSVRHQVTLCWSVGKSLCDISPCSRKLKSKLSNCSWVLARRLRSVFACLDIFVYLCMHAWTYLCICICLPELILSCIFVFVFVFACLNISPLVFVYFCICICLPEHIPSSRGWRHSCRPRWSPPPRPTSQSHSPPFLKCFLDHFFEMRAAHPGKYLTTNYFLPKTQI